MARDYSEHQRQRASGEYTGPSGRFFRLVDSANPSKYYGWSSDRSTAERFTRDPELPDGVVVEAAPRLTPYEASFGDLDRPNEPVPFEDWRNMQEYLISNRVPTIHEAD